MDTEEIRHIYIDHMKSTVSDEQILNLFVDEALQNPFRSICDSFARASNSRALDCEATDTRKHTRTKWSQSIPGKMACI